MTIDLYQDRIEDCSSYLELTFKKLIILNIQNENRRWKIIERLHPVKVIACRTKSDEKNFKTIIKTGVNVENGLFIEDFILQTKHS